MSSTFTSDAQSLPALWFGSKQFLRSKSNKLAKRQMRKINGIVICHLNSKKPPSKLNVKYLQIQILNKLKSNYQIQGLTVTLMILQNIRKPRVSKQREQLQ